MKVYRNRPRKHNQPYVPTIEYRGTEWDTHTVQTWLIDTLVNR
jgi:hypothetical protein